MFLFYNKLLFIILFVQLLEAQKNGLNNLKKDIRDYTDADLERLYQQWEENDENGLSEDEKPVLLQKPLGLDDLKKMVNLYLCF